MKIRCLHICVHENMFLCLWLYLHVNSHRKMSLCWGMYMRMCICECVLPPAHYIGTQQHVAFTSDLCSSASTISERPDSSANVHHICSLSSPLLPASLPLLFLISDNELARNTKTRHNSRHEGERSKNWLN